ncbi:MAG: trimethylamine methyltransferase family protein, partial [Coriobacteriales bacterium]|nr:trimethylamine methyltransferase family protein [Coriobacteriales bacterium]
MPKLEYVTSSEIEEMHQATVDILVKTGVRTTSRRFMEATIGVGLKVVKNEGDKFATIYFSEEQIDRALATAPAKFTIYGLDENNQINWGEKRAYNNTCVGMPFVEDPESHEIRATTLTDLENYVRIADALPYTDVLSSLTAQGIPEHAANAVQVGAMLRNTTKPLRICIESAHEVKDVVAVLTAAAGSLKALQEKPLAYLEISPISPLDYATGPADAMLDIIESGLPLGLIPCPMMGATGPMTLIGSVVMHNAEMLAGVVITQLLQPGYPTIMSPRVTFMDLSTILGLWAAPEMGLAAAASSQLVNRYNIPNAPGGFSCAAKTSDAQAGFEVTFNALLPALIGVDVIGSSGSLDNALVASYTKLLLDDEVCSLVRRALRGSVVDEDSLAVDVVHEIVNGDRNFLASDHTLEHMHSELWPPILSNRQSYEKWRETSLTYAEVANERVKEILAHHKVSPLSEER